jgi:hypothetical protein
MENLVKPIEIKEEPVQEKNNKGGIFILIIFFGVLFGVLSGFGVSKIAAKSVGVAGQKLTTTSKQAGVQDSQTFKDSAMGKLVAGGINGEGTHHLVRTGGDSQNVYLTSSVIDLNQFVGKNVKVYGQTNSSQTAGWFMDVGKIEVQ